MSILLDTEKIKSSAKQIGIINKAQLDQKMSDIRAEVETDGSATRAGSRAWDGFAISESNAQLLAQALEVTHFQILQHKEPPPWIALRNESSRHQKIITLEIKDANHSQLFELDAAQPDGEHLVKLRDKWRLNLIFKPNYHVLVAIRNKTKHMIMTPDPGNKFPSQWHGEHLYLPSDSEYLRFPEQDGGGFREIIVIACEQDVFPQASPHDDNIFSLDQRNTLATKLQSAVLKEKYWVDSYAFYIQDSRNL